jgi:hypothetical protein
MSRSSMLLRRGARRARQFASGFTVPSGALDRWFAARALSASQRVEVVVFGDSTTWGSEATGGGYSWIDRIRDKVIASGFTDGGKGIFGSGENLITLRDASYEVNGFVSKTFSGTADGYDNLAGGYMRSSAGGQVLTVQGYGNQLRLWYTNRSTAGDLGLTIDGGAETVVQCGPATIGESLVAKHHDITGLSGGLHTVVITNKGGATVLPLAGVTAYPVNIAGSLSVSTTYYYVATAVTGSGETTASNVATATPNGAYASRTVSLNGAANGVSRAPTGSTYSVYRGSSSSGPFGLVASGIALGSNNSLNYNDTGSSINMSVNPPLTNTAGRASAYTDLYVAPSFMFDVGIVWQKHAIAGGRFYDHFHGTTIGGITGAHDAQRYQTAFGLVGTTGSGSPTSVDGYVAHNAIDASYVGSAAVAPKLGVLHLGFNDLTAQADTDYSRYTEAIKKFGAACRASNCDGVVLSGQLPYNAKWPTYGAAIFNAMKAETANQGLAHGDLLTPVSGPSLSYAGGTMNPHLYKAQYQAQADYLWDGLLGVV